MRTILVVDDDDSILGLLEMALAAQFRVWPCRDGAQAVAILKERAPDVLLADLDLPGVAGEEVARFARTRSEPPVVFLMSAADERLGRARCLADETFAKPFDLKAVLSGLAGAPCPCGR